MKQTTSSILFQNANRTVFLVDIPTSIALGQCSPHQSLHDTLLSCRALEHPYPSTEPKSASARANVEERMDPSEQKLHTALEKHLREALEEIRNNFKGDWCLPRHFHSVRDGDSKATKRIPQASSVNTRGLKASKSLMRTSSMNKAAQDDCSFISAEPDLQSSQTDHPDWAAGSFPPLILSPFTNEFSSFASLRGVVVSNQSTASTRLKMGASHLFSVPPLSTFILSDIQRSRVQFTSTARKLLKSTKSQCAGKFDFILLDPPWANRSVRNGQHYKTTEVQTTDPWTEMTDILDEHIADNGLVAVWTTNKASCRAGVLHAFAHWGVELIEIWTWVKTTVHGETVTELNGLWRKPYEILFLGRKVCKCIVWHSPNHCENVSRGNHAHLVTFGESVDLIPKKVIFAVPDVHSRKPCLKELIEPMMPDPATYRALEVFARNLTAGWWSWGDEVLKFNWEGHWTQV